MKSTDQTAFISGGPSGIGAHAVRRFVRKGVRIVILRRNAELREQAGGADSLTRTWGVEFGSGPVGAGVTPSAVRVAGPAYGRSS
ncbi:hypothetical protein GCM10009608_81940 [Pseudonocardia alaniniphila]